MKRLYFRLADQPSTIPPTHLKMRPLSEIPAPVKVSAPRAWLPGSNTCDGSRRLLRRRLQSRLRCIDKRENSCSSGPSGGPMGHKFGFTYSHTTSPSGSYLEEPPI